MTDYAEQIKQSVSALDVCHQYGIPVTRSGYTCCPFHGEKTPSMKIYPGSRGYHCFGCHKGGDVIDFVRQIFGLDFRSALSKINRDFGLGLPVDEKPDREAELAAKKAAYQRRKEQERRKKHHDRLYNAWNFALKNLADMDKVLRDLPSQVNLSGLEDIAGTDLYSAVLDSLPDSTVYALVNIDGAEYRLAEAEYNLRNYEKTMFGRDRVETGRPKQEVVAWQNQRKT